MESDIIDEIERHLSAYRYSPLTEDLSLSLTHIEEPNEQHKTSGFNKSWCKLGLQEKLNRLMKYLAVIQSKITLDARQVDSIRKYFYDNVNTTLASDDYVNYDPVEGEIVTILGLKYDESVYIQTQTVKPEGLRVKQRVFANLQQLKDLKDPVDPVPARVEAPQLSFPPSEVHKQTAPKKVVVIKKKIESV